MPQKIMYLIDSFETASAGTEGQLLQLVRGLDPARYQPEMTVLRQSEYILNQGFPCPVRALGITKLASFRSVAKTVRYALQLRREGFRIAHCFLNDSSIIAPLFLRIVGIRVLVSRRDMGFWYTDVRLVVLRLLGPFVSKYIANSEAVKAALSTHERVPRDHIAVIYNGYSPRNPTLRLNASLRALLDANDSAPVIGIVANLRPIKRIDLAITALGVLRTAYPHLRLVVVGADTRLPDGSSMQKTLTQEAERLGVADRVAFVGRFENPHEYIQQFNVAILCSESEGLSNSIIEYMYARVPVVCTDVGGNRELIQDGVNGLVVPPSDAGALAKAVARLLSDPSLCHRLARAAYESGLSRFSSARMVMEHMNCYDGVLRAPETRAEG